MKRKTILFIGGYGSKGGKAETLRQKRGWNVLALLPDYDKGLTQWITAAAKILEENPVSEIHASSTGALVACQFPLPKVLYSLVIDPFRQPRDPLFSKKFLQEAYVITSCSPCKIILSEKDDVLFEQITLDFCRKNHITPIISPNDDHRLTRFFGKM
ncbi:hypothetical protein LA303_02550 [Candidatus Sulfidibacterium hydrothermale]|uniref:hypothetical protein n=1 Tax=Candidatus Sulfidibacterium hydrothermale TaxID=2875962 RepID=UPI001F0AA6D3|nr:hypothetical protein [Candidatus Sulfidibacterium hydrothermale]UBM62868.1 hypothetical protein LA303_02550 [Candidatus Sulfidibacterium hydrothermale]